jgi:hypothetical protein
MDANTAALNLIQKWVGSDDKIADMSAFYEIRARNSDSDVEAKA